MNQTTPSAVLDVLHHQHAGASSAAEGVVWFARLAIMHLSMLYCPTYHPTGKRWGFDRIWPINMPRIRGIWSIFTDNRGKYTVLWWGHLILVFAPGERQLISYRSNPPPFPMGWYLGQYIDRCIIQYVKNSYSIRIKIQFLSKTYWVR